MATIVEMINPLTGLPEQVDKLDHTAQEIDDAVGLAPQLSNPNLLDNWYFGNPVDQRQGRIVKPNTTYYSDNTLTTAAGTTSAYVPAYRYATGTANGVNYASFKLEDSDTAPTYYAAPENVVRGYTGSGYGIDRWITDIDAGGGITITDNGIVIASAGTYWGTRLDNIARLSGKTVTGSILMSNGTLYSGTIESVKWQMDASQIFFSNTDITSYISKVGDNKAQVEISTARAGVEILAAKLELGSHQTLAHQDADGNWVLNEIPDYGEQLARCQRYHFEFGPSHVLIAYDGYGVNSPVVYFPVQMRTVSAIKVYSKAGTENAISYWNGSAEVDFTDFYLEWNENFVTLMSHSGAFVPGGIYSIGKLIAYADL